MNKHNVLKDQFKWIPPEQRNVRFGAPIPPRNPELRKPLFWLARDNSELYFVNASDETLIWVEACSGGFQSAGEEVVAISPNNVYRYEEIEPDTAVKIEEYDWLYDSDNMLQTTIRIHSIKLGSIDLTPMVEKGGHSEQVLMWNTGELGKQVTCNPLN